MRLLVDESVEYSIVLFLRRLDHDVVAICEEAPSLRDEDVLTLARKQLRVLITNDKDFGMLIFYRRMVHSGVILLRLSHAEISIKITRLRELFAHHGEEIPGSFVVVEPDKIRIRRATVSREGS